ncbi:hypothetical protein BDV33DRAFT_175298 [Aspergillus novoparasiticus]|uniref:Uncharacterized protein n=1 Tax=Aspergillus novoparasiticus TaxID=986946 RepID=A0A5N6ENX9_9EURO|nr:hypothetical protein BDV33DRAFT_175298 [Aspergillus novoparasiticus]
MAGIGLRMTRWLVFLFTSEGFKKSESALKHERDLRSVEFRRPLGYLRGYFQHAGSAIFPALPLYAIFSAYYRLTMSCFSKAGLLRRCAVFTPAAS